MKKLIYLLIFFLLLNNIITNDLQPHSIETKETNLKIPSDGKNKFEKIIYFDHNINLKYITDKKMRNLAGTPTILSIAPNSIYQGQSKQITVTTDTIFSDTAAAWTFMIGSINLTGLSITNKSITGTYSGSTIETILTVSIQHTGSTAFKTTFQINSIVSNMLTNLNFNGGDVIQISLLEKIKTNPTVSVWGGACTALSLSSDGLTVTCTTPAPVNGNPLTITCTTFANSYTLVNTKEADAGIITAINPATYAALTTLLTYSLSSPLTSTNISTIFVYATDTNNVVYTGTNVVISIDPGTPTIKARFTFPNPGSYSLRFSFTSSGTISTFTSYMVAGSFGLSPIIMYVQESLPGLQFATIVSLDRAILSAAVSQISLIGTTTSYELTITQINSASESLIAQGASGGFIEGYYTLSIGWGSITSVNALLVASYVSVTPSIYSSSAISKAVVTLSQTWNYKAVTGIFLINNKTFAANPATKIYAYDATKPNSILFDIGALPNGNYSVQVQFTYGTISSPGIGLKIISFLTNISSPSNFQISGTDSVSINLGFNAVSPVITIGGSICTSPQITAGTCATAGCSPTALATCTTAAFVDTTNMTITANTADGYPLTGAATISTTDLEINSITPAWIYVSSSTVITITFNQNIAVANFNSSGITLSDTGSSIGTSLSASAAVLSVTLNINTSNNVEGYYFNIAYLGVLSLTTNNNANIPNILVLPTLALVSISPNFYKPNTSMSGSVITWNQTLQTGQIIKLNLTGGAGADLTSSLTQSGATTPFTLASGISAGVYGININSGFLTSATSYIVTDISSFAPAYYTPKVLSGAIIVFSGKLTTLAITSITLLNTGDNTSYNGSIMSIGNDSVSITVSFTTTLTSGIYTVTVVFDNPTTINFTLTSALTVAPLITSISPNSLAVIGGTNTIQLGYPIDTGSSITIGSQSGSAVSVNSSNVLSFTYPGLLVIPNTINITGAVSGYTVTGTLLNVSSPAYTMTATPTSIYSNSAQTVNIVLNNAINISQISSITLVGTNASPITITGSSITQVSGANVSVQFSTTTLDTYNLNLSYISSKTVPPFSSINVVSMGANYSGCSPKLFLQSALISLTLTFTNTITDSQIFDVTLKNGGSSYHSTTPAQSVTFSSVPTGVYDLYINNDLAATGVILVTNIISVTQNIHSKSLMNAVQIKFANSITGHTQQYAKLVDNLTTPTITITGASVSQLTDTVTANFTPTSTGTLYVQVQLDVSGPVFPFASFTIYELISSVSPTNLNIYGGDSVTATLAYALSGTTATIGGSTCTVTSTSSLTTSLACTSTRLTSKTNNLVVSGTDTNGFTQSGQFTIGYNAITISSVSPTYIYQYSVDSKVTFNFSGNIDNSQIVSIKIGTNSGTYLSSPSNSSVIYKFTATTTGSVTITMTYLTDVSTTFSYSVKAPLSVASWGPQLMYLANTGFSTAIVFNQAIDSSMVTQIGIAGIWYTSTIIFSGSTATIPITSGLSEGAYYIIIMNNYTPGTPILCPVGIIINVILKASPANYNLAALASPSIYFSTALPSNLINTARTSQATLSISALTMVSTGLTINCNAAGTTAAFDSTRKIITPACGTTTWTAGAYTVNISFNDGSTFTLANAINIGPLFSISSSKVFSINSDTFVLTLNYRIDASSTMNVYVGDLITAATCTAQSSQPTLRMLVADSQLIFNCISGILNGSQIKVTGTDETISISEIQSITINLPNITGVSPGYIYELTTPQSINITLDNKLDISQITNVFLGSATSSSNIISNGGLTLTSNFVTTVGNYEFTINLFTGFTSSIVTTTQNFPVSAVITPGGGSSSSSSSSGDGGPLTTNMTIILNSASITFNLSLGRAMNPGELTNIYLMEANTSVNTLSKTPLNYVTGSTSINVLSNNVVDGVYKFSINNTSNPSGSLLVLTSISSFTPPAYNLLSITGIKITFTQDISMFTIDTTQSYLMLNTNNAQHIAFDTGTLLNNNAKIISGNVTSGLAINTYYDLQIVFTQGTSKFILVKALYITNLIASFTPTAININLQSLSITLGFNLDPTKTTVTIGGIGCSSVSISLLALTCTVGGITTTDKLKIASSDAYAITETSSTVFTLNAVTISLISTSVQIPLISPTDILLNVNQNILISQISSITINDSTPYSPTSFSSSSGVITLSSVKPPRIGDFTITVNYLTTNYSLTVKTTGTFNVKNTVSVSSITPVLVIANTSITQVVNFNIPLTAARVVELEFVQVGTPTDTSVKTFSSPIYTANSSSITVTKSDGVADGIYYVTATDTLTSKAASFTATSISTFAPYLSYISAVTPCTVTFTQDLSTFSGAFVIILTHSDTTTILNSGTVSPSGKTLLYSFTATKIGAYTVSVTYGSLTLAMTTTAITIIPNPTLIPLIWIPNIILSAAILTLILPGTSVVTSIIFDLNTIGTAFSVPVTPGSTNPWTFNLPTGMTVGTYQVSIVIDSLSAHLTSLVFTTQNWVNSISSPTSLSLKPAGGETLSLSISSTPLDSTTTPTITVAGASCTFISNTGGVITCTTTAFSNATKTITITGKNSDLYSISQSISFTSYNLNFVSVSPSIFIKGVVAPMIFKFDQQINNSFVGAINLNDCEGTCAGLVSAISFTDNTAITISYTFISDGANTIGVVYLGTTFSSTTGFILSTSFIAPLLPKYYPGTTLLNNAYVMFTTDISSKLARSANFKVTGQDAIGTTGDTPLVLTSNSELTLPFSTSLLALGKSYDLSVVFDGVQGTVLFTGAISIQNIISNISIKNTNGSANTIGYPIQGASLAFTYNYGLTVTGITIGGVTCVIDGSGQTTTLSTCTYPSVISLAAVSVTGTLVVPAASPIQPTYSVTATSSQFSFIAVVISSTDVTAIYNNISTKITITFDQTVLVGQISSITLSIFDTTNIFTGTLNSVSGQASFLATHNGKYDITVVYCGTGSSNKSSQVYVFTSAIKPALFQTNYQLNLSKITNTPGLVGLSYSSISLIPVSGTAVTIPSGANINGANFNVVSPYFATADTYSLSINLGQGLIATGQTIVVTSLLTSAITPSSFNILGGETVTINVSISILTADIGVTLGGSTCACTSTDASGKILICTSAEFVNKNALVLNGKTSDGYALYYSASAIILNTLPSISSISPIWVYISTTTASVTLYFSAPVSTTAGRLIIKLGTITTSITSYGASNSVVVSFTTDSTVQTLNFVAYYLNTSLSLSTAGVPLLILPLLGLPTLSANLFLSSADINMVLTFTNNLYSGQVNSLYLDSTTNPLVTVGAFSGANLTVLLSGGLAQKTYTLYLNGATTSLSVVVTNITTYSPTSFIPTNAVAATQIVFTQDISSFGTPTVKFGTIILSNAALKTNSKTTIVADFDNSLTAGTYDLSVQFTTGPIFPYISALVIQDLISTLSPSSNLQIAGSQTFTVATNFKVFHTSATVSLLGSTCTVGTITDNAILCTTQPFINNTGVLVVGGTTLDGYPFSVTTATVLTIDTLTVTLDYTNIIINTTTTITATFNDNIDTANISGINTIMLQSSTPTEAGSITFPSANKKQISFTINCSEANTTGFAIQFNFLGGSVIVTTSQLIKVLNYSGTIAPIYFGLDSDVSVTLTLNTALVDNMAISSATITDGTTPSNKSITTTDKINLIADFGNYSAGVFTYSLSNTNVALSTNTITVFSISSINITSYPTNNSFTLIFTLNTSFSALTLNAASLKTTTGTAQVGSVQSGPTSTTVSVIFNITTTGTYYPTIGFSIPSIFNVPSTIITVLIANLVTSCTPSILKIAGGETITIILGFQISIITSVSLSSQPCNNCQLSEDGLSLTCITPASNDNIATITVVGTLMSNASVTGTITIIRSLQFATTTPYSPVAIPGLKSNTVTINMDQAITSSQITSIIATSGLNTATFSGLNFSGNSITGTVLLPSRGNYLLTITYLSTLTVAMNVITDTLFLAALSPYVTSYNYTFTSTLTINSGIAASAITSLKLANSDTGNTILCTGNNGCTLSNSNDALGTLKIYLDGSQPTGTYDILVMPGNFIKPSGLYIGQTTSVLNPFGLASTAITDNQVTLYFSRTITSLWHFTTITLSLSTNSNVIIPTDSSSYANSIYKFTILAGLPVGSYFVTVSFTEGDMTSSSPILFTQLPMVISSFIPAVVYSGASIASLAITFGNIVQQKKFIKVQLIGTNTYLLQNPTIVGNIGTTQYANTDIAAGHYTISVQYSLGTITSSQQFIAFPSTLTVSVVPQYFNAGVVTGTLSFSDNLFDGEVSSSILSNAAGASVSNTYSTYTAKTIQSVNFGTLSAGIYDLNIDNSILIQTSAIIVLSIQSVDTPSIFTGSSFTVVFTISSDYSGLTLQSVKLIGKVTTTSTNFTVLSQTTITATFTALNADTYTPSILFTNTLVISNTAVTIIVSSLILTISLPTVNTVPAIKISGTETLTVNLSNAVSSITSVTIGGLACGSVILSNIDSKSLTCTTPASTVVTSSIIVNGILGGNSVTGSYTNFSQSLQINNLNSPVLAYKNLAVTLVLDQVVTSSQITSITALHGTDTAKITITSYGSSIIFTAYFPVAGTYTIKLTYLSTLFITTTIAVNDSFTASLDIYVYSPNISINSIMTVTAGPIASSYTTCSLVNSDLSKSYTCTIGTTNDTSGTVVITSAGIDTENVYDLILGAHTLSSAIYIGSVSALNMSLYKANFDIINSLATVSFTSSILTALSVTSVSFDYSTTSATASLITGKIQFSLTGGLPVGSYIIRVNFSNSKGSIITATQILSTQAGMTITSYSPILQRSGTAYSLAIIFANIASFAQFTNIQLIGTNTYTQTSMNISGSTNTVTYPQSLNILKGSYTVSVKYVLETITSSVSFTVTDPLAILSVSPQYFALGDDINFTITFNLNLIDNEITSSALSLSGSGFTGSSGSSNGATLPIDFGTSVTAGTYALNLNSSALTLANSITIFSISSINISNYFTNNPFKIIITLNSSFSLFDGVTFQMVNASGNGTTGSIIANTKTTLTVTFVSILAGNYNPTVNFTGPILNLTDLIHTFIVSDLISSISPTSLNIAGGQTITLILSSAISSTALTVKVGDDNCSHITLDLAGVTITCTTPVATTNNNIITVNGTATGNTFSGTITITKKLSITNLNPNPEPETTTTKVTIILDQVATANQITSITADLSTNHVALTSLNFSTNIIVASGVVFPTVGSYVITITYLYTLTVKFTIPVTDQGFRISLDIMLYTINDPISSVITIANGAVPSTFTTINLVKSDNSNITYLCSISNAVDSTSTLTLALSTGINAVGTYDLVANLGLVLGSLIYPKAIVIGSFTSLITNYYLSSPSAIVDNATIALPTYTLAFINVTVKSSLLVVTKATENTLTTGNAEFQFSNGLDPDSYTVYINYSQGSLKSQSGLLKTKTAMTITSYSPIFQLTGTSLQLNILFVNTYIQSEFTSIKLYGKTTKQTYTFNTIVLTNNSGVVIYPNYDIVADSYQVQINTIYGQINTIIPFNMNNQINLITFSPISFMATTQMILYITLDSSINFSQFTNVNLISASGIIYPLTILNVVTTVLTVTGIAPAWGLYQIQVITTNFGSFTNSLAKTVLMTSYMSAVSIPCTYTYNNLCVTICPLNTAVQLLNNVNTCVNCSLQSLLYYKGACVRTVPTTTVLINSDFNVYVDCITNNLHVYNNKCIAACPTTASLLANNCINNSIITSDTTGNSGVLLNGQILPNCPIGYAQNSTNVCIKCRDSLKFELNGVCIATCPTGYYYDSVYSCLMCSDLSEQGNVSFLASCYEPTCDSNAYLDSINKKCIICKDTNTFLLDSTCVSVCPDNTLIDITNGICESCPDSMFTNYVYKNQCISFCPSGTTPTASFTCTNPTQIAIQTNSSNSNNNTITTSGPSTSSSIQNISCTNSPCNTGQCSILLSKIVCTCSSITEGNYCQYKKGYIDGVAVSFNSYVNSLATTAAVNSTSVITVRKNLDNTTINTIYSTGTNILKNNQNLTTSVTMTASINNLLKFYTTMVTGSPLIQPNPNIFKIVDLGLTLVIPSAFLDTQSNAILAMQKTTTVQKPTRILIGNITTPVNINNTVPVNSINNLFASISRITLALSAYNKLNGIINNNTYFYDHFGVQIFDMSNNLSQTNQISDALKNGMSSIDFNECNVVLSKLYSNKNITTNFISYDTSYLDSILNSTIIYSNRLTSFFNNNTLNTIKNLTDYCYDTNYVNVNMTIKGANLSEASFESFIKDNINIFNTSSAFYQNRCFSYQNTTTGLDVPLSTRQNQIFPSVGFSCGSDCAVTSIGASNLLCKCKPVNSVTAYVYNISLPYKSNSNWDLINCYQVNISLNIGFYVGLGLVILCFTSMIIFLFNGYVSDYVDIKQSETTNSSPVMKTKVQPIEPVPVGGTKVKDYSEDDNQVINKESNKALKDLGQETDRNPDENYNRNLARNNEIIILFDDDATAKVNDNKSESKNVNMYTEGKNFMTDLKNRDDSQRTISLPENEKERGFCKYFIQTLVDYHLILQCYLPTYHNTKPRILRIIMLYLVVTIEFLFNAIFYNDDLIQNRNYYYKSADKFWDVIIYQIAKSVYSLLIALGVYLFFSLIIVIFGTKYK